MNHDERQTIQLAAQGIERLAEEIEKATRKHVRSETENKILYVALEIQSRAASIRKETAR